MPKLVIDNEDVLRAKLAAVNIQVAQSVREALDSQGRKMLEEAFVGLASQSLAYRLGQIRERRFGI